MSVSRTSPICRAKAARGRPKTNALSRRGFSRGARAKRMETTPYMTKKRMRKGSVVAKYCGA
jgi:hypothetical protein